MNKQSIIFILIGIVLILGVSYLVLKPKNQSVTGANTNISNQQDNNASTTQQPPVGPAPIAVTIDYKSNTTFEPQPIHATENQEVTITVSSDIKDEVHLHGYDVSQDVAPGQPAILKFTTKDTGRFELELENKKIVLGALEVHPR